MLATAGGIVLGFIGICCLILVISIALRTPATPDIIGSVGEGIKGFLAGMKKP